MATRDIGGENYFAGIGFDPDRVSPTDGMSNWDKIKNVFNPSAHNIADYPAGSATAPLISPYEPSNNLGHEMSNAAGVDGTIAPLGSMDARVRHSIAAPGVAVPQPNGPATGQSGPLVGPARRPDGSATMNGKYYSVQDMENLIPAKNLNEALLSPQKPYAPKNLGETIALQQARVDAGIAVANANKEDYINKRVAEVARERSKDQQVEDKSFTASSTYKTMVAADPVQAEASIAALSGAWDTHVKMVDEQFDKNMKASNASKPMADVAYDRLSENRERWNQIVADKAAGKAGAVPIDVAKGLKQLQAMDEWRAQRKAIADGKTAGYDSFRQSVEFQSYTKTIAEMTAIKIANLKADDDRYDFAASRLMAKGAAAAQKVIESVNNHKVIPARALLDVKNGGSDSSIDNSIAHNRKLVAGIADPTLQGTWDRIEKYLSGASPVFKSRKDLVNASSNAPVIAGYKITEDEMPILSASSDEKSLEENMRSAGLSEDRKKVLRKDFASGQLERDIAKFDERIEANREDVDKQLDASVGKLKDAIVNTNSPIFATIMSSSGAEMQSLIRQNLASSIADELQMDPSSALAFLGPENVAFSKQVDALTSMAGRMHDDATLKTVRQDVENRDRFNISMQATQAGDRVYVRLISADGTKEIGIDGLRDGITSDEKQSFTTKLTEIVASNPAWLKDHGAVMTPKIDPAGGKSAQIWDLPPKTIVALNKYPGVPELKGLNDDMKEGVLYSNSVLNLKQPDTQAYNERPDLVLYLGGVDKFKDMTTAAIGKTAKTPPPDEVLAVLRDNAVLNRMYSSPLSSSKSLALLTAAELVVGIKATKLDASSKSTISYTSGLMKGLGFNDNSKAQFEADVKWANSQDQSRRETVYKAVIDKYTQQGVDAVNILINKGVEPAVIKNAINDTVIKLMSEYERAKPLRDVVNAANYSPNTTEAKILDKRAEMHYNMVKEIASVLRIKGKEAIDMQSDIARMNIAYL